MSWKWDFIWGKASEIIYKRENSDTKYTLSKESEDTIVPAELCKCYKLHTLWRRQQGRMWKYNRDP